MNFKKIRKFRRNAKAISPIIATLLLIAIAVVAALVTYAWVMGYIGIQTTNAGNSVLIQSVNMPKDIVTTVYIQNTGTNTVIISPYVYVGGVQYAATGGGTLTGGSTATLTVTGAPTETSGSMVTVKVTTTTGTYSQVSVPAP